VPSLIQSNPQAFQMTEKTVGHELLDSSTFVEADFSGLKDSIWRTLICLFHEI
jgi:hypothetical protein